MSTTEPTTEAGKLRARIEKDAQEINDRASHFESLRVVNALAAFGLDACQAGIEATGRLTEAEAALSQLATAGARLEGLESVVCGLLHLKRVRYTPGVIVAEFFGGTTMPLKDVHDCDCERGKPTVEAALSQFTPERIQRELEKHRMEATEEVCPCGRRDDHLAAALSAALLDQAKP